MKPRTVASIFNGPFTTFLLRSCLTLLKCKQLLAHYCYLELLLDCKEVVRRLKSRDDAVLKSLFRLRSSSAYLTLDEARTSSLPQVVFADPPVHSPERP